MGATAPAAERLGLRAYVVGGAVRDLVQGREPTGEWDMVVLGEDPEGARALSRELARTWRWRDPVPFDRFGTYLVSGPLGPVEVSHGLQRTAVPSGSPDPLVRDAQGRDFTVNALFISCDPDALTGDGFQVLDPTGKGLDDLERGILRTPVPSRLTFLDDPLRIIRAARLSCTLNLRITPSIGRWAGELAPSLSGVAPERIREEMDRILMADRPSRGLGPLARWGAFAVLMPEIQAMAGFRQLTPHHYPDLFRHTLRVVDRIRPHPVLRWAALLHDVGKPATVTRGEEGDHYYGHESAGAVMARDLLMRYRVSRRIVHRVEELIRLHMVQYSPQWSDRAVRRFIARCGDALPDLLDLVEADTRSLRLRADKLRLLAEARSRAERISRQMPPPRSPLDGDRIMSLLGIGPGPEVGRAKEALAEAVVDGLIGTDRREAEDFLLNWWRGNGDRRT